MVVDKRNAIGPSHGFIWYAMVGSDIQAGYNIVFICISYLGNETLYMLFIQHLCLVVD